jgi:hypothetical protein
MMDLQHAVISQVVLKMEIKSLTFSWMHKKN